MAMNFKVDESFWRLFPDAKIGIVVANEINNQPNEKLDYSRLLLTGSHEAWYHLQEETFTENPVIAVWREAYRKFKTKKGARSSIEAMLKRVHTGKGVGPINPLVNIYNLVSLKYGLPCGGEDMDQFVGDIQLTLAQGDEKFIPLGSDENNSPDLGEVIYKDDLGAICRCWNWRESVRTMLTEDTKNAFLCIELIQPERFYEFSQSLLELKKLVEAYVGGKASIHIIDIDRPGVEL